MISSTAVFMGAEYYTAVKKLQGEFFCVKIVNSPHTPEFEEDGAFYVCMIKEQDWENLIAQGKVYDVASVKKPSRNILINSFKRNRLALLHYRLNTVFATRHVSYI